MQLVKYLHDDEGETLDPEEFATGKSANLLLWIVGGFFVLFLLWASLTQVDRTVRGEGRVVPSSKLQVVSNLEGGIVEEILVKPGQLVKKGDSLIRLSPTLSASAYGSTSSQVDVLQTRIARLNAEIRGTTPAYGDGPSEQIAVESSLHAARQAELRGLMGAAQARVIQAERGVGEAQAAVAAKRSILSTAQRELEMLKPLENTQIIPKIDIIKAENAVAVGANDLAAAQASVSRAQSAVAEARAAMSQQRSDWLSRAGMELSQAQGEVSAQLKTLPALSDRVDRTVIRAPMSGRVNRVLVTTVGGSVQAGQAVAEIVPTENTLYIEALIRPSDIANVRLGQDAKIEITAFNSAIYGTIAGKVTSISPDAVLNEKTGESFYTVELQSVENIRDPNGRPLRIGPGMVAIVSLLGEKRSILSYLFTPIMRLGETAFRE
jgi:adhesin transport system membrane fusion protein